MNKEIEEYENKILIYLYENRLKSPQSLTKIKVGVHLENRSEDTRILKSCLEILIQKNFIKKQEDRGNYKIDIKGIEYLATH